MWLMHFQNKELNRNQSLAVFSPFYNQKTGDKRSDFKDLKFASIESLKIVSLFNGTLFAKEKATKTNFIKEKENFDIFHLSMHSQLFEDDFNKSCLLFSNEDRLFFSELYGMNIPASMVVLSACDTGNGTLKSGEGIMSMSRALTYAGVQSAVVSLWQVPDKETSEIMISFYENLKKGESKNEALANAKRTFIINNPMKNQPFYWAGFIVNGDVSPIVTDTNWIIYLGFGLVFLVFVFVFRKKLFQFRQ
jgi:CHAT domain-containing protein